MRKSTWISLACLGALLSACATEPPKVLGTGPTMHEVLATAGSGTVAPEQGIAGGSLEARLEPYTRHARNEIRHLFPRLPNPDICLYIDPHLTTEGIPVPGYTTCFPLYRQAHYALPGEVPQ